MIPVISTEDLESSPDFARIWESITSSLLDENGATRRRKEASLREWARTRSVGSKTARARGEGQEYKVIDGTSLSKTTATEDEEALEPEGEESFASEDSTRHQISSENDKQEKLPDFEAALRAVRVKKMKRVILRELFAELPYLSRTADLDPMQTARTASTGGEKPSRIPVAMKTEIKDVTNSLRDYDLSIAPSSTDEPTDKDSEQRIQQRNLSGMRDLILIVSTYLDASSAGTFGRVLTKEEEDLLSDDIGLFTSNVTVIGDALASHIDTVEKSMLILSILGLNGNSAEEGLTPQSPTPSSLLETVSSQVHHLRSLQTTTLPTSLSALRETLHSLLSFQRQLLNLQIQHLETSKHGLLSRYHTSKMAFLSTVAQTMALKTQVLVLEARKELDSSPEVEKRREMLRERMEGMLEEERGLDERIRVLEGVVGEYRALDSGGKNGAGKGEGIEIMKKLGRRYVDIEGEMKAVRRDIELLEGKRKV